MTELISRPTGATINKYT